MDFTKNDPLMEVESDLALGLYNPPNVYLSIPKINRL